MSAREELFEALTDGGWSLAPGEAESVNRLINSFAHELAEQIRDEQDRVEQEERDRFGHLDPETALQGEAVRARADLIDPEAPGAPAADTDPRSST